MIIWPYTFSQYLVNMHPIHLIDTLLIWNLGKYFVVIPICYSWVLFEWEPFELHVVIALLLCFRSYQHVYTSLQVIQVLKKKTALRHTPFPARWDYIVNSCLSLVCPPCFLVRSCCWFYPQGNRDFFFLMAKFFFFFFWMRIRFEAFC